MCVCVSAEYEEYTLSRARELQLAPLSRVYTHFHTLAHTHRRAARREINWERARVRSRDRSRARVAIMRQQWPHCPAHSRRCDMREGIRRGEGRERERERERDRIAR